MVKHRVGQQIKDVILGANKNSKKSAELDYLSSQFKHLKMKIKALIEALKAQHVSLLRMNESRLLVSINRVVFFICFEPVLHTRSNAFILIFYYDINHRSQSVLLHWLSTAQSRGRQDLFQTMKKRPI